MFVPCGDPGHYHGLHLWNTQGYSYLLRLQSPLVTDFDSA